MAHPVAAIGLWADEQADFQSKESAVLDGGSNSGDSNDDTVSATFRCCHFWWQGCIDGPNEPLPLSVLMLLDCGAHIVLIDTDLVSRLGLHCHHLSEPELLDVAVKNSESPVKTMLTEWVKLTVIATDGEWTSCTVQVLVAPNLCAPVILGLPFLVVNDVVTDFAPQMCIDKCNNYNLLNPVP